MPSLPFSLFLFLIPPLPFICLALALSACLCPPLLVFSLALPSFPCLAQGNMNEVIEVCTVALLS